MKPDNDDEPKLWVTILKLVLVAAVFIGGTGLILSYFSDEQANAGPDPAKSGRTDWGISTDSPIRRLH